MHREPNKKYRKEEQASILCFSDTINRRPMPVPPGNDSLSASAFNDDSQLKEFERLLQTSKNKEISGYIEEESVSFIREGNGTRHQRRKNTMEDVSVGLSKLAGIVLAFGEKIDRVEQRLEKVEKKLNKANTQDSGRKKRDLTERCQIQGTHYFIEHAIQTQV